ncbi:hypothetical protein FNV43_RR20258 [Rhamnella rubrinervis]|uniref:Pentatricopeptide repeat-containing protein n=1 Tax=Rhamnella rubrinervis TaxID=2594499 RepID=A0A8K0E0B6_9ROSA|nr:hypothetical protein FNV43_RR20258 [Rhamnella rubrinervis]
MVVQPKSKNHQVTGDIPCENSLLRQVSSLLRSTHLSLLVSKLVEVLIHVTAYSKLALVDEANKVFYGMPEPEESCLLSVGQGLNGFCLKSNFDSNAHVGGVLVTISVLIATALASAAQVANVGSGLWLHGHAFEAFKKFDDILENGLIPDEFTFSALLCMRCHDDLVRDGRSIFKRMTDEFGIQPRAEQRFGREEDIDQRPKRRIWNGENYDSDLDEDEKTRNRSSNVGFQSVPTTEMRTGNPTLASVNF